MDMDACSIHRWQPELRRVTIKTVILPLPAEFVNYLLADGVFLPPVLGGPDGEEEGEDGSDGSGDGDKALPRNAAGALSQLRSDIDAAIRQLGGAVFPKLNWSAPSDAAWILGGSLKCARVRDVCLLLKSSDRIAHDLCDARRVALSEPPSAHGSAEHKWVLALRKWSELRPDGEFRCFRGSSGSLLAACQRDRYSHYAHLTEARADTLQLLAEFQREALGDVGPQRLVWDAYVDMKRKVHLIDLAPFDECTDPIPFDWRELKDADTATDHTAELRLVPPGGMTPTAQLYHGWPTDIQAIDGSDVQALIAKARAAAD